MLRLAIRILLSALLLVAAAPARAEPKVTGLGVDAAVEPASTEDWVLACGVLAGSTFDPGYEGLGKLDDRDIFLGAAQTRCERAVAEAPDSADAATWLGRVYLQLDRGDDAVALLQRGADGGSPLAMTLLGKILIDPYLYGVTIGSDFDTGVALRQQSSDTGFAPGQVDLALALETGNGIDPDANEAFRLYGLAAEQNHPFALYKLGVDAQNGITQQQDYAAAMQWYEAGVAANSTEAMNGIGQLYEFGLGVELNYERAAEYHRMAAERGHAESQAELGYFYERGLGVATDAVEAVAWYEKAAGQGNVYAQAALSLQYLFGPGVEIDIAKGYSLAQNSAMLGSPFGKSIMGFLNAEGMGTERDLNAALLYYRDAADAGDAYSQGRIPIVEAELACGQQAASQWEPGMHADGRDLEAIDTAAAIAACENALSLNPESSGDKAWLARAYFAAGDEEKATPLMGDAAEAQNVLAITMAADLAFERSSDPDVLADALDALQYAGDKFFVPAMFSLGRAYESGLGTAPDLTEAVRWYRLAAAQDFAPAAERLYALGADTGEAVATEENGFGREPGAPF